MVAPIKFSCETTLPLPPERVIDRLLDVTKWSDFTGYGPLPGIRSARFEVRTPEIVGSRIRVQNNDGSMHTEEVVVWEPTRMLQMQLKEFSPPVARLATHFVETFAFTACAEGSHLVRTFELHPKSRWTWLPLWLISFLLKKAIARNLREMAAGNEASRTELGGGGHSPHGSK